METATKEHPTRQRLVEAASQLMHRQGYHATGLQQVLSQCQVPKGSFYFFFRSKEDLGLAVIDHFMDFWQHSAGEALADQARPPLARLRGFFAAVHQRLGQGGFHAGCPVGNLAQEMGDLSPALAGRLCQAIDNMAGVVAGVLEEALERGQLPSGLEPRETAYFIISSWQGALIRMKACKHGGPLETFDRLIFGRLLAG